VVGRIKGLTTVSRRSGAKISFAFFRFGGLLRVGASKISSDIFRFQGLWIVGSLISVLLRSRPNGSIAPIQGAGVTGA
jgi:hypothetical protein